LIAKIAATGSGILYLLASNRGSSAWRWASFRFPHPLFLIISIASI